MFFRVCLLCVSVCEHRYRRWTTRRQKEKNREKKKGDSVTYFLHRKTENERVRARGRVFYQSAKVETETYEGLFVLSENHD